MQRRIRSSAVATSPASRWRLGRFELRVVGAMAAVAFVPLVAALVLGRGVLDEAYRVGVNRQVGEALESGLENQRAYLDALRNDAERTADAIAFDVRLIEALETGDPERARAHLGELLERYEHVVAIHVELGGAPLEVARRFDPDSVRQLELERTHSDRIVRITLAAEASLFSRYQSAGELVDVYRHLESSSSYVTESYLAVYIALLLVVVVAALGFGVVVSRRLTRRITELADATTRVGQGDLTVEVPATLNDEVTDLIEDFNAMVRDIRASRDRIEYLQRVGAWQEMARRLAHEIKNPLTPIQLAVQELHRTYSGDDPRFRQMLEDSRDIVEEEIATLRRLVSEFSSFARLPVPELESAELSAFVAEAMRTLEPSRMLESGERSLPDFELRVELGSERLPVKLDGMMLRRCLDNLVRNAAQVLAESAAAASRTIVVATSREDRFARLDVRDSGPGVPIERREQVFDPYFTTKRDGTGLGLAIVKKVILEHGGTIHCGAAPEGGAQFTIRLPLEQNPGSLESERRSDS